LQKEKVSHKYKNINHLAVKSACKIATSEFHRSRRNFEHKLSSNIKHTHTHTHTTILLLIWNMSGYTRVSRYQKGKTKKVKTKLDLLEQEIVSGSGICWAICKSAPHSRQPRQHPTTQFFTDRMPFLPPNQQCQSTEGIYRRIKFSNIKNDNKSFCAYVRSHTKSKVHTRPIIITSILTCN